MNRTTRVQIVDPRIPDVAEAAEVIRAGGLVAFPTETVYGLGADATNPEAVARIFEAKGRPSNNPLIVHGADFGQARAAVSTWPETATMLAKHFWPGPLSIVLPRSRYIPDIVTGGQDTVGIRVPDSEVALALLRRSCRLIAAPSANRSTGVSPTTAAHVSRDLDGRIDMILDGGRTPVGIESTVIDLTTNPPRLLRPGAITASQISHVLGMPVSALAAWNEEVLKSPGQLAVHYSPTTRLSVINPDQARSESIVDGKRIGLIVAGHALAIVHGAYTDRVDWIDPDRAALELYATLHRWDDAAFDLIEVILPPADLCWLAVRDRLWRASRRWSS